MTSMCGKRRAMLVSVMDGQRPQIRCEGRWRAPYIAARYGDAVGVGNGKWCQSRRCGRSVGLLEVLVGEGGGTGYSLFGSGGWKWRYQVADFARRISVM
jgi:hypothetical protein